MRKITKIIVHCTATQEGKDIDIETVRLAFKKGWRDVGYHFLVKLDGTIEEGRPIEMTGAHTRGENWCLLA